jgi:long-subunit fatty acid transport protein
MNIKYIYQEMSTNAIGSFSYDGIGADMAVLYKVYEHLTIGANFHSKFKMTGDNDSGVTNESPINIQAGAHYNANISRNILFNLMIDLNQTKAYPLMLHFGTELVLYDALALRAGLDDLYAETNGADISYLDLIKHNAKPTIGLGFKWKIGKNTTEPDSNQSAIIFDYALSIEKLGMRNFFTLAYQF